MQSIQHPYPSCHATNGATMKCTNEGFYPLARWGFHFGIIFDLGFKPFGQKDQRLLQAAERTGKILSSFLDGIICRMKIALRGDVSGFMLRVLRPARLKLLIQGLKEQFRRIVEFGFLQWQKGWSVLFGKRSVRTTFQSRTPAGSRKSACSLQDGMQRGVNSRDAFDKIIQSSQKPSRARSATFRTQEPSSQFSSF
ncbi:hypothetical protein AA3271_0299 [Gluconobacter japonicus NBRC 3271]|nr:hypothetical protein AA3271_0299 [Gluconobacter japonicus NBRC 3271]